jgi:hypothetical protein
MQLLQNSLLRRLGRSDQAVRDKCAGSLPVFEEAHQERGLYIAQSQAR